MNYDKMVAQALKYHFFISYSLNRRKNIVINNI